MKKFLVILGCFLFLVGCTSEENRSSEVIRIGGIMPLTGDVASLGILIQNVVNLHVEEINEMEGINGRPLAITWEDGKCNPGDASRAAQKLIGMDKVNIILSGCSGETLGAAPITEKAKVILLAPASSSPEITHAGDFVFRTSPSDASQGKILAEYANAHFKKIGILSEQTDYSVAVADTFAKNFTGKIERENYLPSESDFKTRITKLKSENLDALFINPQSPPKYEIILKQLQEQNWTTPLLINEVAEGALPSNLKYKDFIMAHNLVAGSFVAPDNPRLDDFAQKYRERFGENISYLNYVAVTIDALDILTNVLRDLGNNTTPEAIRDALYGIKDFNGIYEHFAFDENGDSNITHSLFRFDGENFVLLEE